MAQLIGVSEARAHFSRILKRAEEGECFIIIKRGKPVAKIIPFQQEAEITFKKAEGKHGKVNRGI